ncbi:MAG: DUF6049 family protein [Acidimicrobiales bacterium]
MAILAGTLAFAGRPPAGARVAQSDLLELVAQTAAVPTNGTFELHVRVTGEPPGSELVVSVHNQVLNRTRFLSSIDGERLRSRLHTVRLDLDETARESAGTVLVPLPTTTGPDDAATVRLPSEGVYPVSVELLDADGETLDELVTHLIHLATPDPGLPPLRVGLVLPIHAPPAHRPDGTIELDGVARAGLVTLASVFQQHGDVPLTVVPTPETLDALAADPASPDAGRLESLRRALEGRQVLAAPYVDIDPSAWLAEGLTGTLTQLFYHGRSAAAAHVPEVDATTYVAQETIDTDAALWLRDRGVTRFVVPEAALSFLDSDDFPVALTQRFLLDGVDGVEAAMADTALATHAGASGDPVLDAHHLLADLSVLYFDEPPAERGVVAAVPRDVRPDPGFLTALLAGLEAIPLLEPTGLGTLFDEVPLIGAEGDTDGSDDPLIRSFEPTGTEGLGDLPPRLAEVAADLATFDTVAGASPRRDELGRLMLIAGSDDLTRDQRLAYLGGIRDAINRELDQIEPPPRQTFTLTARDGVVPVVLRKTANYPMAVMLRLTGERLEFPLNPDGVLRLELTEEVTRVEVTVRTLTSGDAPFNLVVLTPDGRRELGRSRFTVRSTAVSGVGLALLAGSGMFLVVWWTRNIRRTRRNRHLIPVTPAGTDTTEAGAEN